jgi:hypothetical protein
MTVILILKAMINKPPFLKRLSVSQIRSFYEIFDKYKLFGYLYSLKTDLRFAHPKTRGSKGRAKRRSDENVVKIAFRPLQGSTPELFV